MDNQTTKLKVLATLASRFNSEQVVWAVGASLLLYLKGKTNHFNDIDIVIRETDVPKVELILSQLGTLKPKQTDAHYQTKCFMEAVIDGVEIDVMAGLAIVSQGKVYDCSLKETDIIDSVAIHGQRIPLDSLQSWKRYYHLMGRDAKADLI